MTFTESNTVEALVRDILCGGVTHHTAVGPGLARRHGALSGLGWHYLGAQQLPRQAHEILVEDHVREALIRLNPEITAQPDRADDVLYRLRAILMGVRTTTPIVAEASNGSSGPSRRCSARARFWICWAATTAYATGKREACEPRSLRKTLPASRGG